MKKTIFSIIFGVLVLLGCGGYYAYSKIEPQKIEKLTADVARGAPDRIPLSGTGSMYPTFPKGVGKTYEALVEETVATVSMYRYPTGFSLFDKRYLTQQIGFADIVSFENEITKTITRDRTGREAGFVKRVIGLEGDQIELRNGIVYRNKEALKEPYVARAQSTFGGDFLHECRLITVPAGSVFVMGDNRKGSNDSRHELGFVEKKSVTHFIPFEKQKGVVDALWHDPSTDLELAQRITVGKSEFMKLLNDKRREDNLKPLKYNDKLELSSKKRGEVMLRSNDFSFEATRSGYTMEKAMEEVGYSNIIWGEIPVQGYYESDELFEHLYEFSNMKRFLLDPEFSDFAISEVQGDLNDCPAQVIVIQVAGYRPPNYSAELVNSWKKSLQSLKDTAPGWKDARDVSEYYDRHKADLDRMIALFDIRIQNIEGIVDRMEKNQWLSKEQDRYIDQDAKYAKEQSDLAERLNQP